MLSNSRNWLEKIQTIDPKVKFVRDVDEMENTIQENGQLTSLKVYSRGDNRGKYYFSQCSCGKHVSIWGNHFRSGHTKSCGCARKENSRNLIKKLQQEGKAYSGYDLTGQTINGFKFIAKLNEHNRNREWVYKAICPLCQNECYLTKKTS